MKKNNKKLSSVHLNRVVSTIIFGVLVILLLILASNAWIESKEISRDIEDFSTKVSDDLDKLESRMVSKNFSNASRVEIVSHGLKKRKYTKSPSIVGEVKNLGNEPVNYVKVMATFYDSNGNVVDTAWTFAGDTADTDLQPEQTAPFEISLIDETPFHHYKLDVTWN